MRHTRRAALSAFGSGQRHRAAGRTIPLSVRPSSSDLPDGMRCFPSAFGGLTPTRSMTDRSRVTASRYAANEPSTSLLLSISTAR